MKSIKSKTKTIIIICLVAACALIVSIGGVLSQWVIIPLIKGTPTHDYGDIVDNYVEIDTNEGFDTEATFINEEKPPLPNSDVYGEGFTLANKAYTINWLGFEDVGDDFKNEDKTRVNLSKLNKTTAKASKEAGTHYYEIKDNTTGQILASCHAYKINQAEATITSADITSSVSTYYDGETINYTVKVNITNASGTKTEYTNFTGSTTADFTNGSSSTVSPSFSFNSTTADGNVKYTGTNVSATNIKITHIAYTTVQSWISSTTTYYGRVDESIGESSSGTIYVIPYAETDKARTAGVRTISKASTIASGVTFTIPYNGEKWGNQTSLIGTNELVEKKYVNSYNDSATYLKNQVFIAPGVKLTVNGTLNVGGVCNAGGGGGSMTGQTCGDHALLKLQTNTSSAASMEINGTVECYGFIEATKSSSSMVFNSGSSFTMPFVLYEFRGGSVSKGMQKEDSTFYSCPFNRYIFPNIVGSYKILNGATSNARAAIYASSTRAAETASVIGKTSGSTVPLLELTGTGGYAEITYDPSATDNIIYNGSADPFGKLTLTLNGGANLNSLKISNSLATVSSEGAYLPISYLYDIHLYNGTYDLSAQKIKILPGGSVTVHEGASVEASNIAIYETAPVNGNAAKPYPSTDKDGNKLESTLKVSGSLTADNLGGKIISGGLAGSITMTSNKISDSYDISSAATSIKFGDYSYALADLTANGNVYLSPTPELADLDAKPHYAYRPDSTSPIAWAYDTKPIKITYSLDGGNLSASNPFEQSLEKSYSGLTITESHLPTPTKTYYTFLGWYLDETLVEKGDTFYKDKTLLAKWTETNYTLNFEHYVKGGTTDSTLDEVKTDSKYFTCITESITLPSYTKQGTYTFAGWYDNKEGTGTALANTLDDLSALLASAEASGSTTLYGIWTGAPTFTVTYDKKGGSCTTSSQVYEEGGTALIMPTPTRTGYEFLGWYTAASGGEKIGDAGTTYAPTADITLYAQWRGYTVNYNANRGTVSPTSATYAGTALTLPTPTYTGYKFLGWYTAASGGTKIEGSTYTPTADITLYAQWSCTVTYNANGGTCSTSSADCNVSAGGTVALPTPTLTGYTFQGWYTAASGGEKIESPYKATAAITLYAQWEKTPYTIIVATDNATVSGVTNGQTAYYGDIITFTVTYSGDRSQTTTVKDANGNTVTTTGSYTFTMPASNVTISASSSCITPDTLITLADGTMVRVDSLRGDEELLVWNLETGMLDTAPIMFVDSESEAEYEIVHLYFSDGTDVKVIYEHGFWDYDLNKYVYLDRYAEKYIGHTFAKQNGSELAKVQLVDVVIEKEITTAWSPVTVGHLCYFVNGMLSMPGGVGGLFNIFEVDRETMTYDYEAMQRDIETYGLYTYEELNAIAPLSEDMFNAAGGAYLKISIGKGNLTEEELIEMINRYSKFFN